MNSPILTVDEVCRQFDEFAQLVREMREKQRTERFRESITQSAARATLEDQVDNFLLLLRALPLRVVQELPDGS